MISWIKRKLFKKAREQYNHDKIIGEYWEMAFGLGDGISYAGMGNVQVPVRGKWYGVNDCEVYHILDELEQAYAELGYRIVPLDSWVDYAGWSVKMDHLWLVKRDKDERPHYTKDQPKREMPQQSDIIQKVWETGESHESFLNEDGEMILRRVEE